MLRHHKSGRSDAQHMSALYICERCGSSPLEVAAKGSQQRSGEGLRAPAQSIVPLRLLQDYPCNHSLNPDRRTLPELRLEWPLKFR